MTQLLYAKKPAFSGVTPLSLLFIFLLLFSGYHQGKAIELRWGSTPTPLPIPIPDPAPVTSILNLKWDHDGSELEYFSIQRSHQPDLSLRDQWVEIARTPQVPGEKGLAIDVPGRPAYLVVYTVCICGDPAPSNVLEVK